MWTVNFRTSIGGIERFVDGLARALPPRGVEVTVIANRDDDALPESEWADGVQVVRLPFHRALASGRPEAVAELRGRVVELKRGLPIDLVHLQTRSAGTLFHLESQRRHPLPTVLTMHTGPQAPHRDGRTETVGRTIVRDADWICCVSHAVRADLREVEGDAALVRSSVVYCGIREPAVPPAPRLAGEPRLLCLGRLSDEKGYDVALAALPAVLVRWPGARLIVAGDGPARERLGAQAEELRIAGSVDFAGWTAPVDTAALINAASLVLVPSREESLGLVAVEAALLERPVVGSRVEGLPEAVDDGVTGLLVARDDPEALAGAVLRVLDRPDLAASMGRAGRRLALERFGWTRCVNAYEALYRRIVEEGGHGRAGQAVAAE
jgi:glycosyltransferase involved in cell wall biosynthesis